MEKTNIKTKSISQNASWSYLCLDDNGIIGMCNFHNLLPINIMMNDNVTIKLRCICVCFVYPTTQAILSCSNEVRLRVKGNLALESGITGHVHLLFMLVHGIIFSSIQYIFFGTQQLDILQI